MRVTDVVGAEGLLGIDGFRSHGVTVRDKVRRDGERRKQESQTECQSEALQCCGLAAILTPGE